MKMEIYPPDLEVRQVVEIADPFALPIHPAAAVFPLMADNDLGDLAADIKKNGLRDSIALLDGQVIDGRNRLNACKIAGYKPHFIQAVFVGSALDFVLSCNLHRRHLTPAQKREVIEAVLKQRPEKSNRRVAEETKADHKTVGVVREDLERRGEIPHVATRQDSKGRQQPARRNGSAAPKEQRAGAPKSAKPHPKCPVARRLERWLDRLFPELYGMEIQYGKGFAGLAEAGDGWHPDTRQDIVIGLRQLQAMVGSMLKIVEHAHTKELAACKLLGIPWPPTPEAVATAFRRHAAKEHPDRGGDGTKFQKYVDARDCLDRHLQRKGK
jgi:hypothetical protein